MIPSRDTPPPDQMHRRVIETELSTTLLVEAAAGTGKTTSMIRRMVALLAEGRCAIGEMAAVTFTRKATAELRERFQVALEKAVPAAEGPARKRLAEALGHIEQCFIGTIHSFCGRLLRERPIEAGVDVAFEELDEDEEYRLRESAWDDYAARLHTGGSAIIHGLEELGLELNRLRDAYMRFADYPDVEQWPAEALEMDEDLVDRARDELRRIAAHAAGLDLPSHASRDELMPFYRDLPRRVRNTTLSRLSELMDLLEDCTSVNRFVLKSWPDGTVQGRRERDQWLAFLDTYAKPLVDQWHGKRYGPVLEVLQAAASHFERMRAERGVLSYQDLLMKAAALLRENPHIRTYFRGRFTHLLVDEFQDTDPVQAEVMLLLTADDDTQADWHACVPRPGSLFVVGDPKQSIYRFRRADIVTYNQVRRIIETHGRIVPLNANFRSTEPMINWFNGVSPSLFPAADDYSPGDARMDPARTGNATGACSGVLRLIVPDDLGAKNDTIEHEAEIVARTIAHALAERHTVARPGRDPTPVSPRDFLVLTWTRDPLVIFAEQLQACGVPVEVTGSTAVNDVPEVALLHSLLAALTEPDNPVALVGVLRSELFGISDDELYRYRQGRGHFRFFAEDAVAGAERIGAAFKRMRDHASWLDDLQPVAAIERIAADMGLPARAAAAPGGSLRAGGFAKAIELLRAAHRDYWTPADLAAYLWRLIDSQRWPPERHDSLPLRPHRDAVRVMNLHQAKGLEAPVVFLVEGAGRAPGSYDLFIDRRLGSVRGYFSVRGKSRRFNRPGRLVAAPPDWDALEAVEKRFRDAEHDRLLYVAATRAGAQLVVSTGPRWEKLCEAVDAGDALPGPPVVKGPPAPSGSLAADAPRDFETSLDERWTRLREATYHVRRAKEISIKGRKAAPAAGEHGTEWGTVIHVLLEAAARQPRADLRPLAEAALRENGLEPRQAADAMAQVRQVTNSELWTRARAATPCLTEVPIAYLQPAAGGVVETLVRGVIDLVFRETDGWVIVDYKTDDMPGEPLDPLVKHYAGQVRAYAEAWERETGEPVRETGLFFVRTGVYRTVSHPAGSLVKP